VSNSCSWISGRSFNLPLTVKGLDPMIDSTIDNIGTGDMSKIYCKCGNIVSIDKNTVKLKKRLKKKIECPVCRNYRISFEIEYMNGLFDGTLDEGRTVSFF
jgi:hypothetical protein